MPTHAVTNQPPPLENYNVFETDRALVDAVAREAPESVRRAANSYRSACLPDATRRSRWDLRQTITFPNSERTIDSEIVSTKCTFIRPGTGYCAMQPKRGWPAHHGETKRRTPTYVALRSFTFGDKSNRGMAVLSR